MGENESNTSTLLVDLQTSWKQDSKLDMEEPAEELAKIGSLHSKYLSLLSNYRQQVKSLEKKQKKFKKIKWEYYSGRLDQQMLKKFGWEPFPHILKSDIATYMDADKDMIAIESEIDLYEELVDVCTYILKELTSRTYQIRDIITWVRFTSGA